MQRYIEMRKQFHYEWQIRPKTWFGRLIAGVLVVLLLWLAITFFTIFLIIAGVAIALAILYAVLPLPKKWHVIKRVEESEEQKKLEGEQNNKSDMNKLK